MWCLSVFAQLIKPRRDFLQQWPRQLFSFHRSSVWEFLQNKTIVGTSRICLRIFFETGCYITWISEEYTKLHFFIQRLQATSFCNAKSLISHSFFVLNLGYKTVSKMHIIAMIFGLTWATLNHGYYTFSSAEIRAKMHFIALVFGSQVGWLHTTLHEALL